jgi:hypothetical protein
MTCSSNCGASNANAIAGRWPQARHSTGGACIFTAARTVVDCFRFRNKIGLDVPLEALRDGWRQRKFTLDDLWRQATAARAANVMRTCIEAITA